LEELGYGRIDLVAVNVYPFRETIAKGVTLPEAMEQVDIGGPTMLRAAAKNHAAVLAVVDPDDYGAVLDALRSGTVDDAFRIRLAHKVFAHTAGYDAAIAAHLATELGLEASEWAISPAAEAGFPDGYALRLSKVQ